MTGEASRAPAAGAPQVQTVTGPIPAADLAMVLPMEHLLADFTATVQRSTWQGAPADSGVSTSDGGGFYDLPVHLEILGDLALGRPNRDDLTLADTHLAAAELRTFAATGGGAVVDATSNGLGRDPAGLQELSRRTGVPIVMGSGWFHPRVCPQLAGRTAADLSAEMVAELQGAGGIPAGVIGRLGPLDPVEEVSARLLTAAARASAATGAPILIDHREAPQTRAAALQALLAAGAEPDRIAVAGLGGLVSDPGELERLARAGHFLLFDEIGMTPNVYRPWDHLTLAGAVAHLIETGLGQQLLLSHGLCRTSHLEAYGGPGLGFLRRDFATVLGLVGIEPDRLRQMMTENPRRLLCRDTPAHDSGQTPGQGVPRQEGRS